MTPRILTFDIEIRKCIPQDGEPVDRKYEYCEGWGDKENMGIAFLFAFRSWDKNYRVYEEDELELFLRDVAMAHIVAGFNILGFDIPLLKATLKRRGLPEKTGMKGKIYDLNADIRRELGRFVKGWRMDDVAQGTLGLAKSGDGAEAPRLFQDGKIGKLVSYGIRDVQLEHAAVMYAFKKGCVRNTSGEVCQLNCSPVWVEMTGSYDPDPKILKSAEPPPPQKESAGLVDKFKNKVADNTARSSGRAYAPPQKYMPFPEAGVQPQ